MGEPETTIEPESTTEPDGEPRPEDADDADDASGSDEDDDGSSADGAGNESAGLIAGIAQGGMLVAIDAEATAAASDPGDCTWPDLSAVAPAKAETELPETIGRFEILEEIGRGGAGVVYKALDPTLRRYVAIKVVHDTQIEDEEERFAREARLCAKLRHPGIVVAIEAGRFEGRLYFVMDFVIGENLESILEADGLPPRQLAIVIRDVALALDHAHGLAIIHRDVKPQNILIDETGNARLTDFGTAREIGAEQITIAGQMLGTPGYMSPEQARGVDVEPHPTIDVWGLGAVLYRGLVGRPPFEGETALSVMHRVIMDDPIAPRKAKPSINADLETIILRCLEKDPDRRFPTAAAVADELGRFLAGEAISSRPLGVAERATRWVRRNRALSATLAASAVIVVFLLLAGVVLAVSSHREVRSALGDARAGRAEAEHESGRARSAEDAAREAERQARLALEAARTAEGQAREAESQARTAEERALAEATAASEARSEAEAARVKAEAESERAKRAEAHARDEARLAEEARTAAFGHLARALGERARRLLAEARTAEAWVTLAHILELADEPATREMLARARERAPRLRLSSAALGTGGGARLAESAGGGAVVILSAGAAPRLLDVPSLVSQDGPASGASPGAPLAARWNGPELVVACASGRVGRFAITAAPPGQAADGLGLAIAFGGAREVAPADSPCAAIGAAGRLVAHGAGKRVLVRDASSGRVRRTIQVHSDDVTSIVFGPRGQLLASGGRDAMVRLWSIARGVPTAALRGHAAPITSVTFDPSGKTLATADAAGSIRLWEAATGKAGGAFSSRGDGEITALGFGRQGRRLVVGTATGRLELWDAANADRIAVLPGDGRPVADVALIEGDVVAVGPDGAVRVFSIGDPDRGGLDPATAQVADLVEEARRATGLRLDESYTLVPARR